LSFELFYQPVAEDTLVDLRKKAKKNSKGSRQFGLYKQIHKTLQLLQANRSFKLIQTYP